jgi:hypothetical protein
MGGDLVEIPYKVEEDLRVYRIAAATNNSR